MSNRVYWISFDTMERFMVDVFKGAGVPEEDARICAEVLITSDKRGIDSHGIGRLKPIYYDRIKEGIQNPVTPFRSCPRGAYHSCGRRPQRYGACYLKKAMALAIGCRGKKL